MKGQGFGSTIIEYNHYDNKGTVQQISYPPPFSDRTRIFGSANGLAFLFANSIHTRLIGVFNPSTGESSLVKLCPYPLKPPYTCMLYPCFCYLGGGEYVLVIGMHVVSVGYETWVYKFTKGSDIRYMNKTCSTRNTFRISYEYLETKGTFVRGAVHWPVRFGHVMSDFCRYEILAYHLGENKHMEISPPVQYDFRMGIFVDGCSLLATSESKGVTELWIMKEVEDCWTKYATIGKNINFTRMDPLGFFPNGDLIMDIDKQRLMKYSFNRNEAILLFDYGGGWCMNEVIMCADSLLSPNCMIN